MAVLQMQKYSICALKKDRNAILKTLQSMGVAEIKSPTEEDDVFVRDDGQKERSDYERRAHLSDQAVDILEEYAPQKKGLLASFAGKDLIERSYYKEIEENSEGIFQDVSQITAWNKEAIEARSDASKLDSAVESLAPWMDLDIPMNVEGTKSTAVFTGTFSGEVSPEAIYGMIPADTPCDVNVISADSAQTCVCIVALKKHAKQVEDALRGNGFAKPAQPIDMTPSEKKDEYLSRKEELLKKASDIGDKIKAKATEKQRIQVLADYYRMRADRYGVLGDLLTSKSAIIMEGYLPERDAANVKTIIEDKYDVLFELSQVPEDEDMPILLKNNAYSSSYEGIVQSYGLPHRGEVDPTTIMSFFYCFFFGLMLSDAAYGAVIAIACFIMVAKFPRMSPSMRKSLKMFGFCGLSTVFWGVMFGGYFGDLVNVVSRVFLGNEVSVPALWFTPLDDPMRLLLYSMAFGLVHLFTGLGIKGYSLLKEGDIVGFVSDVIFWYCFLIGLILLFIPTSIFASIAGSQVTFPAPVGTISLWLTIIGAVGLLLMGGRSSKNPVLRIALGAYEIYGITSWLSDVLSYSRLLALGLATGVIAQVVNQMGSMGGASVFGVIMFILVFVIGHVLNLAINTLGAYVHTNRLQYVEFFNKFYEGGGRAFTPFKANTKYVEVKED